MIAPYRDAPTPRAPKRRQLNPWLLALLFGWVCDAYAIGVRLVDRQSVDGYLGFAAILGTVTVVMLVGSTRRPRR